ncbi:910_t:CDS:2 [Entrophospora sp. SA101]|nr:910_t:CDS:2 [Entrophospora sp. SA101]
MERLFQPNHIEGILIAYRNGDTSTQRCRSNKKEFLAKHNEHDPECKYRFIVDSVYYDDSDAFWVYFTEESRDICDEATGIASEEPSFTLNPTYDEERDVFKIDFTDSDPMTTMFKKTEVEDVELEIDNEGKLVTLLFHDASNKMSNISKTSV